MSIKIRVDHVSRESVCTVNDLSCAIDSSTRYKFVHDILVLVLFILKFSNSTRPSIPIDMSIRVDMT